MHKKLYIIAGPNGAGKTTASYNLLPELWACREFVNADEIARGLSPYNPEEVALEAGRLQLERIDYLVSANQTFALETTLTTRSYRNLIHRVKSQGYEVELVFFYLPSAEDAIDRVHLWVLSGGHNIPEEIIRRRFNAGLLNLFRIYMPIVDKWDIYNNLVSPSCFIANNHVIADTELFESLKAKYGRQE